ncbi:AraC family transcriptional regulator [Rathayibacter sp. VKM Ac-2760]|uniref:AraC family transcriptional regulator n=1 Tax=Rathayibacter sp. VKM Ac-2760 TaxID=2609253 RepID=UPI001316BFB4|nr:AraC family transcriptional regulator [Rathayibacter sp. VKM Ac-2760]QHC58729.1 helix-turn-helix domain-containing protein [Rathayibacter sp. VKM Ac-2760]
MVTDCGYFPRAAGHFRTRMDPIAEAIVIACVEGRGWCDTGSGRIEIGPGDVLVVPPGRAHAYGAAGGDPWTVWWLHAAGDSLSAFLRAHGMTEADPVRRPVTFFTVTGLLARVVTAMEEDLTTANLTRAAGTAWHLLSVIVADRPAHRDLAGILEAAAASLRSDLMTKASAAQFAAASHVSVSHFSAQFRLRFGMSVQGYQLQIRMSRARELFDVQRLPVGEVARAVGYSDPLYFSRQFSRLHGVSPSMYRSGRRSASDSEGF